MKRIVTFTGIDDKTDLSVLKELADKYDWIEFGILISLNNTNTETVNRFPSWQTIDKAIKLGLPLSCHICGSLARNYIKTGDFTDIKSFLGKTRIKAFRRFQFNINGFYDYKVFKIEDNIEIIIQVNGAESWRYYQEMLLLNGDKVSMLSDKSGGRGKIDTFDFVADYDEYIGFAGGISKDNIMYILGYIDGRNEKKLHYWVDMESSLRQDDWFSVDIVKEICNEIEAFKGLV